MTSGEGVWRVLERWNGANFSSDVGREFDPALAKRCHFWFAENYKYTINLDLRSRVTVETGDEQAIGVGW